MENVLKILLVEDNLIEIMKMKRTISLLKLKHTLHEAKNGEEGLKFLEDKIISCFSTVTSSKITGKGWHLWRA